MKLNFYAPRGESPVIGGTKLPLQMATVAINAKLTSMNFEAYPDIGNPFQLTKSAPINAVYPIIDSIDKTKYDWLQWSQSEVLNGPNIDVASGPVPNDITGRKYITGLDMPRVTNSYYATDPANGSGAAYPLKTFPLGVANPVDDPTAVANADNVTNQFDYAAENTVNEVVLDPAHQGINYKAGDLLGLAGGTLAIGLNGAQIEVTEADATTGAIVSYVLNYGGFYTAASATPGPAATGGSGTGAQFNTVTFEAQSFNGFNQAIYDNGAGSYNHWTIDTNNQWRISSGQGDLTVSYSNQLFGLKGCISFEFQYDTQFGGSSGAEAESVGYVSGIFNGRASNGSQLVGPALVVSHVDETFTLYSSMQGSNGGPVTGTIVSQQTGLSLATNTMYRISGEYISDAAASVSGFTATVTLALRSSGAIIATLKGFIPYGGEGLGVGSNHRDNHDSSADCWFENILVSVVQPPPGDTTVTTDYVFTWVQQFPHDVSVGGPFQESGPSAPTDTVDVVIDGSVTPPTRTAATITIPAAPTVGLDGGPAYIIGANLYRLVNGDYTLVNANGPIAVSTSTTTTYVDIAQDSALPDVILPSFDPDVPGSLWLPPPADLIAIAAMPGEFLIGISGNQLCASAPGYPHAWPESNRYATESPGVGVAVQQTTAFVLTQANPYTGFGNDPAALTVTKEPSLDGCTSKRSISTHHKWGAIFASGIGITYFRGQSDVGMVRVDGKVPFSYEQWQALDPTSINGVVHNNAYWFSYISKAGKKGSYVLDLNEGGNGLIELDFHVTQWCLDQRTALLYFTPDLSTVPINGSIIGAASNILSQWEGSDSTLREATWSHSDILMASPKTFPYCRVRAEDFTDITLTITNENGTSFTGAVTSPLMFVIGLPGDKPASRWGASVVHTSIINDIQIAEAPIDFRTQE